MSSAPVREDGRPLAGSLLVHDASCTMLRARTAVHIPCTLVHICWRIESSLCTILFTACSLFVANPRFLAAPSLFPLSVEVLLASEPSPLRLIQPRARDEHGEPKTRRLAVRLTPRQLEVLDAAASAAGQRRSDWLRDRWSRCEWDVRALSEDRLALLRRAAEMANGYAHQLNLEAKGGQASPPSTETLERYLQALELEVFPRVLDDLQGRVAGAKLRCGEVSSDLPSSQLKFVAIRVTERLHQRMQAYIEGSPSGLMQTALENQLYGVLVPAANAHVWTELAATAANLVQVEGHMRAAQRDDLADRFRDAQKRLRSLRRRLLGLTS